MKLMLAKRLFFSSSQLDDRPAQWGEAKVNAGQETLQLCVHTNVEMHKGAAGRTYQAALEVAAGLQPPDLRHMHPCI
jgi:hypothetical protein